MTKANAETDANESAGSTPPAGFADPVGLNWKISEKTHDEIREIENNSRRAMANAHNIIAGSAASRHPLCS